MKDEKIIERLIKELNRQHIEHVKFKDDIGKLQLRIHQEINKIPHCECLFARVYCENGGWLVYVLYTVYAKSFGLNLSLCTESFDPEAVESIIKECIGNVKMRIDILHGNGNLSHGIGGVPVTETTTPWDDYIIRSEEPIGGINFSTTGNLGTVAPPLEQPQQPYLPLTNTGWTVRPMAQTPTCEEYGSLRHARHVMDQGDAVVTAVADTAANV